MAVVNISAKGITLGDADLIRDYLANIGIDFELAGRAVANSMFSVEDNPAVGLLTLIVAGAITVVVFLVTALVVRAPELKEVTRRGRVSDAQAELPEPLDPE